MRDELEEVIEIGSEEIRELKGVRRWPP